MRNSQDADVTTVVEAAIVEILDGESDQVPNACTDCVTTSVLTKSALGPVSFRQALKFVTDRSCV